MSGDPLEDHGSRMRRHKAKCCTAALSKYVSLAVFFAGIVGSSVTKKLTTLRSPMYPYSQTQAEAFAGIIVYFPVVLVGWLSGAIKSHELKIVWWHPFLIAFLFSLSNIFLNVGNAGSTVNGELSLLLTKSTVLFSVAFGELPCFRDVHMYNAVHMVAVVLLVAGFVVGVMGKGLTFDTSTPLFVIDVLFLICSSIPLALAFVFIEKQLRQTSPNLHPVWLWALVCVIDAVVGFPLIYLSGWATDLPPHCVWWNFWEGLACEAAGVNLAQYSLNASGGNIAPITTKSSDDSWHAQCDMATYNNVTAEMLDCSTAMVWFWISFIPGFAFNFAMPIATKYGGATLLWFTRAVALPVAAIFFALPSVMGSDYTALTVSEALSILLVLVALLVYELGERVSATIQDTMQQVDVTSPSDPLNSPGIPQRHTACLRCNVAVVFGLVPSTLRRCCQRVGAGQQL